ncbi:MAG TPA: biotin carboxylase N-terminal domain-containing protein [Steroidobacteraceae bacterium]|nr:biotin carboxylase N-terminal domain-containing protein [Steroidobacteraceae bacterium]
MRQIRRLLIANRGEIALRIIRTCRSLGIETVLAASEADLDSVPTRLADRTICIGPPPPARSYLDIEGVVAAALETRVDAVHPGYGFLSENAAFAERCRHAGLVFIGPDVAQLRAVGDKLEARRQAVAAGLPVVPGGAVASHADAEALGREIGTPLLVKAVAGGGGRGMKRVRSPEVLAETLDLAMSEAKAAFGDSRVFLERFIDAGRHVEVQLLGDGEAVIHLGDRDCSVQRRYQKLIEEAPAPSLSDGLRARVHAAAVTFGRHLRYRGLGTVEFLVDSAGGKFYFLEMNARIQVEHPVTEMITGLDLVAEQIAVAEGRPLRLGQGDIAWRGHAVECRINAEDAHQDFRPSPGTITTAVFPAGAGIRVDSHIEAHARVPPFYDSLLAKLITHRPTRTEALAAMQGALANCRISGVISNTALLGDIVADADFVRGGVDTAWLGGWLTKAGKHATQG